MKKLKDFVDNLDLDKKGHVVFGNIINPIIIIGFIVLGNIFFDINPFWFGYIGIILCLCFHYYVEVWQRKTGKGKYELLDALAGSSSAIIIGLILFTIHILT